MKISLLVPCYNEEKSLEASILASLGQRRKFDEIIFVDDGSTDRTPEILAKYSEHIICRRTTKNTGNKSSAQEYGLRFVSGDVMVTTDADTLLDETFAEEVEKSFQNPDTAAMAGRVESIPYNWLTLCRAYEYTVGQNIHKLAQSYMNNIFVMPGAASAFRVKEFRQHITFDHDTITEDLDFTYKLHQKRLQIVYNANAISYTQDPANLENYLNQMRRWFGGGWQNLTKHFLIIPTRPSRAFELSLLYSEGLIFSVLIFVLPILNPWFGLNLFAGYFAVAFTFAIWAAYMEKRPMLMLAPIPYMLLVYINAFVFLEQFVKEVVLRKKNLTWFKPERHNLDDELC